MSAVATADTGISGCLSCRFDLLTPMGLFCRASGDPELADQVLQLLRLFGKLGGRR